MAIVLQTLFILLGLIILILLAFKMKSEKAENVLPENYWDILEEYVRFYRALPEADKKLFEKRVEKFLKEVKITGVNAEVEELDMMLIAAAAIIPVFAIPDWEYINLHEVLLYPGTFNQEFDQQGIDRYVSGMVGRGVMKDKMILTKWYLRQGFINQQDAHNTAIHEFVHLIDKMDGTMDGVPEIILERKYVKEWKALMTTTTNEINNGHSDINDYAATNHVEFFAVVAEYFFEQPALMATRHPAVFAMLEKIFKTNRDIVHLKS